MFTRKKDLKKLNLYKEFFDTYFESIRNYIYYKSSDVDLAEDFAQEVFLKLWENMDQLKPDTIKSYLYTIAANLYNNHYNRKKVELRFISRFEQNLSESPQYILELKEFDELLQKTLSELPEKIRITFLMNRIDKLTYDEIAARLGVSTKAIEKRIKKALDTIKTITPIKI